MAQRIYIVRHGATEWSVAGQHTSRTDLPLLASGREQAAAVGEKLASKRLDLVLCSPLLRARETCRLAGFGAAAQLTDDLQEWDYGEYEGLTTPQIREQNPTWNLWRDGCPQGESPAQIGARVDRVLERCAQVEGDVAAFAHGHVLRVLTARYLGLAPAGGKLFRLDTGTISTLGTEHDDPVILTWNVPPAQRRAG